jgi:hypothetical protein
VEASSLPTDSLYKMLTIGGLVLVVGGMALGWKAIDETQTSQIALSEAESALANASVPVQLEYLAIAERHREIEREIGLVLSGVNVNALKEFKGGQPNVFPSFDQSLSRIELDESAISSVRGVTPVPKHTGSLEVKDWIKIGEEIRKHKELVDGFLTAPNLTVIKDDLKQKAITEFEAIQSLVLKLDEKAVLLSGPQQTLYSAKLRYDLARKRQLSILLVGFVLFCVGVSVFARASKNWYEQVQRYEDAKLQKEVELHTGANEVSVTKELLKLGKPVIVGILLALLLAWVVS